MSRIAEIELEIESIQTELNKLQQEKQQLEQSLPVPISGEPSEVVIAAKQSAVAVAERQPRLTGVMDAIALLEQRLLPLQREFDQLTTQAKVEQERVERARRLRVAQAKIQAEVEKIHDLSALLETAFWELKSLHQEFGGDYRQSQERPDGTAFGWIIQDLVQFNSAQVPQVTTLGDRIVVQSRSVDLFKPEKEAAQMAQSLKSATQAQNREEALRVRQRAEAEQERQRQIERLQGLLTGKKEELRGYERQVQRLISSGYTKSGSNLKLDDSVLGRLAAEIQELETQLQQQEESA